MVTRYLSLSTYHCHKYGETSEDDHHGEAEGLCASEATQEVTKVEEWQRPELVECLYGEVGEVEEVGHFAGVEKYYGSDHLTCRIKIFNILQKFQIFVSFCQTYRQPRLEMRGSCRR